MKRKKDLYPGTEQAEKEKDKAKDLFRYRENMPDMIGTAPNYEKFKGWDVEKVLTWLNID